jgi:uncharacterized membrane protein YfcA
MENEYIGIILFAILSLISALSFHYKLRKFFLSSILAAFSASLLFQIIGFFLLGYLDPFFLIAFVSTLLISFIVSMLVGMPFLYYRKKANITGRT